LVTGDWKAYQYLIENIKSFQISKSMIKGAGFGLIEFENLSQGIAKIHLAFKKEKNYALTNVLQITIKSVTKRTNIYQNEVISKKNIFVLKI